MPLFLKILDFYDRHYNYNLLSRKIVLGARDDDEKVMRIFEWTYRNIKRIPQGLPVIDDHIWYTIVRGYADKDQFSDIFATLCNHAGVKALFSDIYSLDGKKGIVLSFVRLRNNWHVFDPYNGVYFIQGGGGLAQISNIKAGSFKIASLTPHSQYDEAEYMVFLNHLPDVENIGLTRASTQSPLNRLFFEVQKHFAKKK